MSCLSILCCELYIWTFLSALLSDAAYLLQSSDGSVPEDLLAQLHDFPLVPSHNFPLAEDLLSSIYENEDPISGKHDFSISSEEIDPSETLLGPEEEKDTIGAFLHASQILRKYVFLCSQALRRSSRASYVGPNLRHPGLVMEHFDPATSVHTFKVACPRPHDGLSLQLSSPSPSSLSNGST
jgi:hypothetical protein